MKAALRSALKQVECVEIDKPTAGDGEVIIKVAFAGICGSDIHRMVDDNEKWNRIVLGHEFSGYIEEIGEGVEGLTKGDRVTAVPLEPCHHCKWCQQGLYSLCGGYSFVGSRKHGAFAQFVRVKADNVLKLGDKVSMRQGALMEPVTVTLHPVLELGTIAGKRALIIGSGTIGVLAISVLKKMGVSDVTVSDVVDQKLELATRCGADRVVNVLNEPLTEVAEKEGLYDIVLECSGTHIGKNDAMNVANGKGTIVFVGTSPKDAQFSGETLERINRKELTIKGSWMNYSAPWPGNEWKIVNDMMNEGLIDEKLIVSHEFGVEDMQKAYDVIFGGEYYVKILIAMGEE